MTKAQAETVFKKHRELHDQLGGTPSDQFLIDFNRPEIINKALLGRSKPKGPASPPKEQRSESKQEPAPAPKKQQEPELKDGEFRQGELF